MCLYIPRSQLGGVILPNDGSCKISGTTAPQDYNDWITLDYPSIGQIAQALRENEIIPVFAAQQTALPGYQVTISAEHAHNYALNACMHVQAMYV